MQFSAENYNDHEEQKPSMDPVTKRKIITKVITSDVHGSAQSRKPAEAEPKIAGPEQAVVPALEGLWLRLNSSKAIGCGTSHGLW